ncbi:MAG: GNAT family N-acetyltransferase [Parachlamydiaceae bacterium]|nr:GNAT family N-acetyltransferase [Parachlamydiaceae bacterium]
MELNIREAKIEEAHTIAQAEREIAQEPGLFCSMPSELTDENVVNTISTFIKNKKGIYLVAELEGQLIGHAFLEPYHVKSLSHVADLNIVVHKGWQRKGVGKQLLAQIVLWAKSSGIEKIQLNVRATNFAAISLYRKFGFTEEGRLKKRVKINHGYIDDIVMGLSLCQNLKEDKILVREIQKEDVKKIIQTFCFPWSSFQETTKKWENYYKDHQENIRSVYLIEFEGSIIGYANLFRESKYPEFQNASIPEINDVWISSNWRHRGYGELLIRHIENMARIEGYKQIGLGVGLYKDYGSAQKLYFKLGYIPDGKGITYDYAFVTPGEKYPVDDDLLLWLTKSLD